jgi:predicted nucleotide-binding protein
MPFGDLLNDHVTLVKKDGRRFENLPAAVQSNLIFTNDAQIPIEDGDSFERQLPSGITERFSILDAGFMQEFHGMSAHYQSKVRKQTTALQELTSSALSSPDELKGFLVATLRHLNTARAAMGLPEVAAVLNATLDGAYWPVLIVESASSAIRERPVEIFRFDDVATAAMNYHADADKFRRRGELLARVEGNDKVLKNVKTPEGLANSIEGVITRQKDGPAALPKRHKVLIVHGQNLTVLAHIDRYLYKELGLETVVMKEGAHKGRTLAEKFEQIAAECSFGVFIFTADDHLVNKVSGEELKRARQNVVLEAGFMWGAIGRHGKAAFLVQHDPLMELPSDIDGIGWIPITSDLGETKLRLRDELVAAGLVAR